MNTFTYEITSVYEEFKVMDVLFKADGVSDVTVSVRFPVEGESLDDLMVSFAPFGIWDMETAVFVTPIVGSTNTVTPVTDAEVVGIDTTVV
jgi:hypothetical protein